MILGIESAASALSLALFSNGTIHASITVNRPHCHDECLSPGLEQLLSLAGSTVADINAVAVASGPGSFTGLRIGMAAAKGIALARSIPLLAVPTFQAMAHRIQHRLPRGSYSVATVLDARREDVYYAVFSIDGTRLLELVPAAAGDVTEVAQLLPVGCLLAGDGAKKLTAACDEEHPSLGESELICHAEAVAAVGELMLARGEVADTASCEPLYLRDFKPKSAKALF